jgi:serine/threonine-protein kinase
MWTPLASWDTRAAWAGSVAEAPGVTVRVEAAAWRGRPVFFKLVWPWTRPMRMDRIERSRSQRTAQGMLLMVFLSVAIVACLLARRNVRLGRGDRRGASRLAAFILGTGMIEWAFSTNHVPGFSELSLFIMGLSWAMFGAGVLWMLYLALEPYVRRRFPHTIISWSRVLAGSLQDPLVGRDLLIGALSGIGGALLAQCGSLFVQARGAPPLLAALEPLLGARYATAQLMESLNLAILTSLALFLLLFLLRVLLRRQWLAAGAFVLMLDVAAAMMSEHPDIEALRVALALVLLVFVLMRFGLLALATGLCVYNLLGHFPITPDLGAWYSNAGLFALGIIAALAVYGFRTALGGRPLFKDELV